MRRIKFRGKREDNGEWVYGAFYPIKDEPVCFIINNCQSIDFDDNSTFFNGYKVHKKSVGQFIGLHDKNGKEIYMGDIVTYKRSVGNWTGRTMTTTHKIIFTEEINAFVMECGSSYIKLRKHWGYEYEVIGNIFENPDLVKL